MASPLAASRVAGFTFGQIFPNCYGECQQGTSPSSLQTECILRIQPGLTKIKISFGFLQSILREIGELPEIEGAASAGRKTEISLVPKLEVDGQVYRRWMEAVERTVSLTLDTLPTEKRTVFTFDQCHLVESICDRQGRIRGVIQRTGQFLQGRIDIQSEPLEADIYKVSVRVSNDSSLNSDGQELTEQVLQRCFVSAELNFEVENVEFIGLPKAALELHTLPRILTASPLAALNIPALPASPFPFDTDQTQPLKEVANL